MEMQEIQGVALVANEDTILRQFSEQKQRLMDFQDDLEDIIPTLLSANGIEVANISFRIKNEDSLRKKIQFKRKYQQLTDVTDLIGCRIVTLFEPDMERVLEVLTREFEMIELVDKRKKSLEGYIDFGYNSCLLYTSQKDDDEDGRDAHGHFGKAHQRIIQPRGGKAADTAVYHGDGGGDRGGDKPDEQ